MLRLRPTSPRSAAIAAGAAASLGQPNVALMLAEHGLQAQGQGQGQDEPYHRALLHLTAAQALVQGGAGGSTFPVAALQAHLEAAKAAKAACRAWLPTALKVTLRTVRTGVRVTDEQIQAAQQVRAARAV